VLNRLLERSVSGATAAALPGDPATTRILETEDSINDQLIAEAGFLADLVRWDYTHPKGLPPDKIANLVSLIRKCRAEWRETWLEEWLLKELGGFVPEWWPDVRACSPAVDGVITSNLDFRCPICFSAEHREIREQRDLSYSLGRAFHDLFEEHVKCARCGTHFTYRWGGGGLLREGSVQ